MQWRIEVSSISLRLRCPGPSLILEVDDTQTNVAAAEVYLQSIKLEITLVHKVSSRAGSYIAPSVSCRDLTTVLHSLSDSTVAL